MIDIKFEEAGFNKQNFQKSHKLKKSPNFQKIQKLQFFSKSYFSKQ